MVRWTAVVALMASGQAWSQEKAPSPFSGFEVGIGLDGGGPLMFRDTPDDVIEPATVFEYGTRLAFRFGDPEVHHHRFGLGLGLHALARSGSRKLGAVDPMALYATGGATEVQFGAGYRVAMGGDGFTISGGRVPYSGPMGSLELRHSFLDGDAEVPLGLVAGLFAEGVLGSPTDFSTCFAGARIDLTWRKAAN